MKRLFCLMLTLFLLLCLVGCTVEEPLITFDYIGIPVTSISYCTTDYMGGASRTVTIDFISNTTTVTKMTPNFSGDSDEYFKVETEVIGSFTDEAEEKFINQIYSLGFFTILPNYQPMFPVIDGGGWDLVVEYENGWQKRSSGSNAGPELIFSACSIPFYRLTGIDVLGGVPTAYKYPPNVSYALHYSHENNYYSGSIEYERADYRWNDHIVSGSNLYDMAIRSIENRYANPLIRNVDYSLVIYTSSYRIEDYDIFKSIEIRSYNIDPELTDEKLVYSSGWFSQEEIPLEPDRIYLVTIEFYNGDFTQYTFNTAASDQKIFYGFYSYIISGTGQSRLHIYDDGSFELEPFNYSDKGYKDPYSGLTPLAGKWAFETIDGAEYLVLTDENGDRLVFECGFRSIKVNNDKTTLDLKKYNLDGKGNDESVEFKFYYYERQR